MCNIQSVGLGIIRDIIGMREHQNTASFDELPIVGAVFIDIASGILGVIVCRVDYSDIGIILCHTSTLHGLKIARFWNMSHQFGNGCIIGIQMNIVHIRKFTLADNACSRGNCIITI